MRTRLFWRGLPALTLALLAVCLLAAAPPKRTSSLRSSGQVDDIVRMARQIDRVIAEGLQARKAVVAPGCSDSEFVRRIYLDLIGRIPRVSEVREFLADSRPDKRSRLVESLLASPNYANHFANVWRSLLLPSTNNQQVQFLANQIQEWARAKVRDNVAYDKMARELITAPVALSGTRGRAPFSQAEAGPLAFFQVNELKPENLAASTSRIFLGVTIECAQCHDHPFAQWTRKQFWEYAAFFAGIKPQNPMAGAFSPVTDDPKVREISLPNTEKKVQARFLDGGMPVWKENASTRVVLAEWLTSPDNPFFARAVVNRMWEHFFGIGLVDPVDDFREENPPSHPELLEELARGLVAHQFDLKYLIRVITASNTYQRTSVRTHASQEDLRSFARMPLKGMTPEQVFESLATAVGYRGEGNSQQFRAGFAGNSPRGEILSRFANPVDRKTEFQTSILQALALMNGRFIADATSLDRSETLAAVIDSPFMDMRQKLDTLYLAALARPMRGSEAGRLIPYVESGGPSRDSRRALADVFWVLLNSSEFILNH